MRKFFLLLIKPSHYDDDGYVVQWMRSWIPSNSLACLYAITQDVASRRVLEKCRMKEIGLTHVYGLEHVKYERRR